MCLSLKLPGPAVSLDPLNTLVDTFMRHRFRFKHFWFSEVWQVKQGQGFLSGFEITYKYLQKHWTNKYRRTFCTFAGGKYEPQQMSRQHSLYRTGGEGLQIQIDSLHVLICPHQRTDASRKILLMCLDLYGLV